MSQMQDDDSVELEMCESGVEVEVDAISRKPQSTFLKESATLAPESPRMKVINEADESLKTKSDSSHSAGTNLSKDLNDVHSLEANVEGMLQTMENAKMALFTPARAAPPQSQKEQSDGKSPFSTGSKVAKESTKAKSETKTNSSQREAKPKDRTPRTTVKTSKGTKESPKTTVKMSKGTKEPPKAGAKIITDAIKRRIKPLVQISKTTITKSKTVKGPTKARSKSKIGVKPESDKKNRPKSKDEEPPKVQAETNTDATQEEAMHESAESSLDFRTSREENSDKGEDFDSSSSTKSGSDTAKTESGLLENEKGDMIISASRFVFFGILGISAIVITSVAYGLFRRQETETFKSAFKAQAEEMELYTRHNVDSAFATLNGLAISTTSVVKRLAETTDYPPGFINVPDVAHNLGLAKNKSSALIIAYMPKVLSEDFERWENYSSTHKNWIAEEQPDGPVDLEPKITPFTWEFSDYEFEKIQAEDNRFLKKLERPGDCSGAEHSGTEHLRRRDLANTDDGSPYRFEYDDNTDDDSSIYGASLQIVADRDDKYHTPVWQIYPIPIIDEKEQDVKIVNYNLADRLVFSKAVEYMENSRAPVFLDVCDQSAWFLVDEHVDILQTVVAYPVFDDFSNSSTIVGFFTAIIPWEVFFVNNLGPTTNDMIVVVNNTCGEIFSVQVSGNEVAIMGEYDGHDPNYNHIKKTSKFAQDYNREDFISYVEEICLYEMTMYPSKSFEDSKRSNTPLVISIVIFLVFIFTSFAFMLFDCLVTRRQNKLLSTALRQNAIVNSLFPKSVQKKLMEEADVTLEAAERAKYAKKRNLTTFLIDDVQKSQDRKVDPFDSKPIADLFPHTTIMFADISGFTAWSSAREPAAVFTLLETIYRAFDDIAKRRKVFKVEVVGDCYVAVCGLPDARKDHYAVMCRFAQDCMAAMHVHTKELEVRLGPDTGDLSLRVGLHSGPVVAGVLRGDKSRFQLFGDTMNTASRMESTGTPNRIQLSQATADLLIINGKEHWITKRQDKVKAKGKGEMTTYFLLSVKKKTSSTNSASTSKIDEVVLVRAGNHTKGVKCVQKRNRVADWVVEMLGKLLKEMKAKRKLTGVRPDSKDTIESLENKSVGANSNLGLNNKTVIDEVSECLKLPGLNKKSEKKGNSPKASTPAPLDKEVIDELQHYVYSVASLYKKNPFHNFEHASHVSMSCIKLLNRIASHDEDHIDRSNHHTYGICSDPLTSFGIVFAALIHDVDHSGVPNSQLVKEHSAVATLYKNKSVAEQNSIDLGWGLLMEPTYANLRRHIYTTVAEYKCFRQIVVNCIMATDIVDKDLIKARNKRWDLAFSGPSLKPNSNMESGHQGDKDRKESFRKATVVIEHLIQLSDVSHTMQHWHMYRRWNERLFEESYKAYVEGRAEKNPSENWYQGELGFYDFYIIPLAKKIKQCAVFGVSSDEYLSYAVANRAEWEERGNEVLEDMVKKMEAIYHKGSSRQPKDLETGRDANISSPISECAKFKSPKYDGSRKVGITAAPTSDSAGSAKRCDTSDSEDDKIVGSSQPKDLKLVVEASDSNVTSEGSHSESSSIDDDKKGLGVEASDANVTSEGSHSESSSIDDDKKGSRCHSKALETEMEASATSPPSESAHSESSSSDNDKKVGCCHSTDLEASAVSSSPESDASFKSAHSQASQDDDSKNENSDLEMALNGSYKSVHSEASRGDDAKNGSNRQPMDLVMVSDANDTDDTSETTHSKASASDDLKNQ